MKISIIHIKSGIDQKYTKLYDTFIRFLQKEFPLKHNLKIYFLGDRMGHMTTGARTPDSDLKILSKGRLNRDILRTIAHEWVHEYDTTILKKPRTGDVGGENENKANSESGRLVKLFEQTHPDFEEWLYE